MAHVSWTQVVPRSLAEVAVVMLVFAAGFLAGAHIRPLPADWLGFAGALIGAAATVAGSVYVLDRERNREERDRKAFVLTLLDDLEAACVPFQLANEAALKQRYRRTTKQQADEVKSAIRRLKRFCEDFKPRSVAMMKVSDAILSLQIDPDFDRAVVGAGMYPDSADFGELNGMGHALTSESDRIRSLLVGS